MTESRRGARVITAVLAVAMLCPIDRLPGCGLCPVVRGGLTVVHQKSLDIAIAIRRDLDAGLLEPAASARGKKHSPFRDLQIGQVLAVRHGLRDGFELLVIEDGTHYRIDRSVGLRRRRRAAPPPATIVRWVTGRAVLEALLKKQLTPKVAVQRGLLVIESTPATATHPGAKRSGS